MGYENPDHPPSTHELRGRISALRGAIDELDVQLVSMMSQRFIMGKEIQQIKEELGDNAYDAEREKNILHTLRARAQGGLPSDTVEEVWRLFFREVKKHAQEELDRIHEECTELPEMCRDRFDDTGKDSSKSIDG